MNIKLIAIDIDGTILNDKGKLLKVTKNTIIEAQERGIKVVLVTGRSPLATIDYAKELKIDKFVVIELKVNEENIIQRLSARRVCNSCGKIFNLMTEPPKKDGTCDDCNGSLYQRDDDKEVTIRERFKVYNSKTAPLIEYYAKKGMLKTVTADGSIEAINKSIAAIIDKAFNG